MTRAELTDAGSTSSSKTIKGSPEEAARLTAKLIDQDKVIAIIAGGTSGNSRAAAPKAQSSHIPLISPSSTDPAVTQAGDYIFRACFVDSFQGEVMASFAANTLKAQKAAIIFDFNSPYGRGLTEFLRAQLCKAWRANRQRTVVHAGRC